jgi:hypothetical protein
MKVATVAIAWERRVGRLTDDGRSSAPFDLPLAEANEGVVALVGRDGHTLPPVLSPISLGDVVHVEIGGIGVPENQIVERSP